MEQCWIDTLTGRDRYPGEHEIVRDGEPQFISHEQGQFVHAAGVTNVCTHSYHLQSNGKDQ